MKFHIKSVKKHPGYHHLLSAGQLSPDGFSLLVPNDAVVILSKRHGWKSLPQIHYDPAPNRVAAWVSHLPALIWLLRRFRIEGEAGAGDTLARLLHKLRLSKLLNGRRCRCDDGRRWLNQRFPH